MAGLLDRFRPYHADPAMSWNRKANGNGNGKHAAPSEAKLRSTIPLAPGDFWPYDSRGNVFNTDVLNEDWYAVHWLVYACMRIRAIKLVEAPLWVFEETEGEQSPLDTHEIYALLEEPNPDQSIRDLLTATSVLLDTGGSVLWVKNRNGMQGVGSLTVFGADQILNVEGNDERLHARFKIQLSGGRQEWFDAEDVVYFREHAGVAPLHTLGHRLGIDRELMHSMAAGLRNSVMPGHSLEFGKDAPYMGGEQIREWRETVLPTYEGARNAGKFFVSGNASLKQHKLGFDGLEGGEIAKEIEVAVCSAFQIPAAIVGTYVGLQNSSDRANMETAERYLYDMAVIPRWRWMSSILTKNLLRDFDEDTFRTLQFADEEVAALQQDFHEKAEIVAELRQELTLNERRGLLGYEAVEGGDESPASRPEPEPFAEEEDDPDADPDEQQTKPPLDTPRRIDPDRKVAVFDERQVAWQLYHASAEAQEYGWMLAARSELEKDRAAVLALFDAPKAEGDAASPEEVRRLRREAEKAIDARADDWSEAIAPLTSRTAEQAVQRVAAQVGLSFDLLQPGIIGYTQKEAVRLVKQVTDTTKQAVRDALSAGLLEGESIPDLAKRIEEAGAFAPSRAELIARTETTRVTNGAGVEALKEYQRENGGAFRKSWLTARDSRVRDEHVDLDGEEVGLDEAFSNGLEAPGEPNCRCTTLLRMVDDNE